MTGSLIPVIVYDYRLTYNYEVKILSYCADFGVLIRMYREDNRYSMEKLAELCDISDRCIGNIERGMSNPKLDTMVKLCKVCGINIGLLSLLKDDKDAQDDSLLLTR